MPDPYQILGVSPSASEDEITQAYRKLAKKYHPDLHPGDKEAEKKMQEINAAYQQIRTQQHGGASYEKPPGGNPYGGQQSGQGSNPYGDWNNPFGDGPFAGGSGWNPFDPFDFFGGGQNRQQQQQQQRQQQRASSPRMQAVNNFIRNRQYEQALRTLSEMGERDAEWYYYSALANAGEGNRVTALNHAREAVRREPGNDEYNTLLNQFEQGGFEYRQTGQTYGFDMQHAGGMMMRLCAAQMLCMCCCRPF